MGFPLGLAVAVGIPLVGGQLAALSSMKAILGWYKKIKKPKWTPPNWLFGPAWGVFYTAMGTASWIVWKHGGPNRVLPLTAYGVQLVLNLAWQPLFFRAKKLDYAFVDATAMLGTATVATVLMAQAAKPKAVAGLMVPYLGWLAFATALTYRIWQDNPNADQIKEDSPSEIAEEANAAATQPVKKAQ